ncbi:hypothetical protein CYMTET_48466 [Cymbomonas tetramitiformis]|uniref:BCNT-C domain-containing protein n=1 Tax=Cymbomonas tetramitiformis TaxID=36881 RepID=A0AAE0BTZ9_9CHLO|nr:hypothetical protein CYMTET_48466 [Cymbomonas tetramitiformis]
MADQSDIPEDELDSEEEDEDFDPTAEEKKAKRSGQKRDRQGERVQKGGRAGGIFLDDDTLNVDEAVGFEEKLETTSESSKKADCVGQPEEEQKDPAQRAKINAIWEKMNAGNKLKGASTGFSLASICKPVKRRKKVDPDRSWMAGLNALSSVRRGEDTAIKKTDIAKGVLASAAASLTSSSLTGAGSAKAGDEGQSAALAGTLPPGRGASVLSAVEKAGKVVVTERRVFAGEDITMVRELEVGSKEAKQATQKAATPSSGIDAVLNQIEKKRKMNILDKSKVDWGGFKQEQEVEVVDDLETYKKGKDTHIEKQDFLKRAELREYELERDARLATSARRTRE